MTHESMNKSGTFQYRKCRRSLAVDGDVRQQTTFCIGKGTRDLMKAGKCDHCIAKAAQPVNQNAFDSILHSYKVSMLSWAVCSMKQFFGKIKIPTDSAPHSE